MVERDKNIADAFANLSGAIKFKTISYQDKTKVDSREFIAFHEFLLERFPLIHKKLKREVVADLSLLYIWEGSQQDLNPLILAAHIDVVPVPSDTLEDWIYPPFEGFIDEEFIWGRGTMDCKGFLIAIMEAVEQLLAQGYIPRRRVILAFGHDEEEGGWQGANHIARLLETRNISAEAVIDEGGFIIDGRSLGIKKPLATIGLSEKGNLTLKIQIETEGGHSSMPPRQTAIGILATALSKLEKKPFPARFEPIVLKTLQYLRPELPFSLKLVLKARWLFSSLIKYALSRNKATSALLRTTIATTIIAGGTKENVLPQKAHAIVNFRLLPGDSVDYILSQVTKRIKDTRISIEILGKAWEASTISDIKSNSFEILRQTIKDQFPETAMIPFLVPGVTDCRHYTILSQNVFRFCPLRVTQEDQERAHGTNERIKIDNFEECITFYKSLIKNYDVTSEKKKKD